MFSRIVIAFDGTPHAEDALVLARRLADAGTELVVCCTHPVGAMTARMAGVGAGVSGRIDAEARLEAARQLLGSQQRVRFVNQGASSPAIALHEVAQDCNADLIVVGASHRGPVGRILPGTTAARVLHEAPCAVAVAPHGGSTSLDEPVRRIGVGFDGSTESRHALSLAAQLAEERHGHLEVITAIEPLEDAFGYGGAWLYPEYVDDAVPRAEAEIRDALSRLPHPRLSVQQHIVEGAADVELLGACEHLDLLVLGSRAHGPVGRVLLGSVAMHVAAAASCPMLAWPRSAAVVLAG